MQVDLLKPFSMDVSSRSSCLPGTRVAIINEILDWVIKPESDGTKNILWLHGVAGSGKSTIATTVAGQYQKRGQLGCHMFFVRERSHPMNALQTIAYSLAVYNQSIAEYLADK